MLSLVRGYARQQDIRAFVASQAALNLKLTPAGAVKVKLHLEKLLPGDHMIHQKPAELTGQISDFAASILARVLPKSFRCDNGACYRHAATFGEIIFHPRVNKPTHAMMGELVPECITAFLKDVAIWARRDNILTEEDMHHLDRLQLPMLLISGKENRMFVPASTEETYDLLSRANGAKYYERKLYDGFGHLDCYIGEGAADRIWPDIARTLDSAAAEPAMRIRNTLSGEEKSIA